MKNKLYFYFSGSLLLTLIACSGGLSGPAGGTNAPVSNLAAPIQESGAPGTRFDPGSQAKYRLSIRGDFQKTNEGTLLLSGDVSKVVDKAPDFAGHVLRAVDFRNQKYIDVPLQPKDDPQVIAVEQAFDIPYITSKEVLDTPAYTLAFYVSPEAATNPSDQWRKTLACTDPKCDTSNWNLVVLEVKPLEILTHHNLVDDTQDGEPHPSKTGLTLIPEPAP